MSPCTCTCHVDVKAHCSHARGYAQLRFRLLYLFEDCSYVIASTAVEALTARQTLELRQFKFHCAFVVLLMKFFLRYQLIAQNSAYFRSEVECCYPSFWLTFVPSTTKWCQVPVWKRDGFSQLRFANAIVRNWNPGAFQHLYMLPLVHCQCH